MARLSVTLLGPLEVTLDGEPITTFQSSKVRALLAYLAVEADRPHRRDALATLLWPNWPDRAARANLRRALSNLRRAIGDRDAQPPFLHITRETIQFSSASDCWVDVVAFRALVGGNRVGERATERLEEGVALYGGPFLEGFSLKDSVAFDDWSLLTREEFHRQALTALQRLVERYERGGEWERACGVAWRQVELEPWREEARRELMYLLAVSGQRSAALAQYEACRRTLMEALGVEPAEETVALYERIREGAELPSPSRGPPHNLPTSLIPLIGREAELAEIQERLQDPACRLLTVIGPGGVGKSRLAIQAAVDQVGYFIHGAYLVNLAPLGSPDLLASTITEALNVSPYGSTHPNAQLVNLLREKELLLVLDNFEHLVEGTTLIAQMLKGAPGLKLLVTSRERLNLREEWLLPLEGLHFPDEKEIAQAREEELAGLRKVAAVEGSLCALEHYSAIQFFVHCARRVRPDFSLVTVGPSSVARICQLVEGIPLAIELAAPWTRVMGCQEIAQEIEGDLGFLASSLRDMPRRHRSMRAVFDHSWGLLSAEERDVLRKLSVFRGGFRREAAEAVAVRLSQSPASLAVLSALVDSSWLRATPSGRYEMHQLIRQYCEEHLEQDPEGGEQVRDRHSEYYAAFLDEREACLKGRGQKEALQEILAEMGNVRAAWSWAIERGDVEALGRCAESLWLVSERRGWYRQMEQEFGRAAAKLREQLDLIRPDQQPLAAEGATIVLAQILCCQAHHCFRLGSAEAALALLEESLTLLRGDGRSPRQQKASVRTRVMLGWILDVFARDRSRSDELLQEALDQATEAGDQWTSVFAAWSLGRSAWQSGQYLRAETYLRQGITITDESGDQWFRAWCLDALSQVLWAKGEYQRAASVVEERYQISRELGDRVGVSASLLILGQIAIALGKYDLARQHYQDGLAIARQTSDPFFEVDSLTGQATVASVLGEHAEARQLLEKALALPVDPSKQLETLVGLGHATLALGEIGQSRRRFREALELAVRTGMTPRALSALAGMAHLLAHEVEPERALELLALVLQHPATFQTDRDRAQRLLTRLELMLSPEAFAAATAQGQARELDEAAAEILTACAE